MLAIDTDCVEITSSGQQTYIQPVPGVSTINTKNENLLDYLQAKVSTIRSKTTDTSTAVTLIRQYTDLNCQFISYLDQ